MTTPAREGCYAVIYWLSPAFRGCMQVGQSFDDRKNVNRIRQLGITAAAIVVGDVIEGMLPQ